MYAIKDKLTYNLKYIGITNNPYNRFRDHINRRDFVPSSNILLYKWITDSINLGLFPLFEIIHNNISMQQAKEIEISLIKYYGKKYNKSGILFNITDGGDGIKKVSKYINKEIIMYDKNGTKINTYKNHFEIANLFNCKCVDVTNACTGKQKTFKKFILRFSGDPFNLYETKHHKGRQGLNTSKKVYQYDLDGNFLKEYNSLKDAALNNNSSQSNISCACSEKTRYSNKYQWRLYKKENIGKTSTGNNRVYDHKLIGQYNKQGIFINKYYSHELFKQTGFLLTNIIKCCRNKQKTAYGYTWKYF